MLLFNLFEYIDSGIKFDNNKCNQKLQISKQITTFMS